MKLYLPLGTQRSFFLLLLFFLVGCPTVHCSLSVQTSRSVVASGRVVKKKELPISGLVQSRESKCTTLTIDMHPDDVMCATDKRPEPKSPKPWCQDPATAKSFLVKAVRYKPRPIGSTETNSHDDLYTARFIRLHRRDLAVISRILGANTVRLEPWNNKLDHSEFLDECAYWGLYVIPAFNLRFYFVNEQLQKNDMKTRLDRLKIEFEDMITTVQKTAPILMWSVNYALMLNETVGQGRLSRIEANSKRDTYFAFVKEMRRVHIINEWDTDLRPGEFLRPLSLPLHLDARLAEEDASWFLAFAETYWGLFPTEMQETKIVDDQVESNTTLFNMLRKRGSFDAWIVETMPTTTEYGIEQTIDALRFFNATSVGTTRFGANSHEFWPDPTTMTKDLPDGTKMKQCNMRVCVYKSKKLAIMQYGFGALGRGRSNGFTASPESQQRAMQNVWEKILNTPTTASGEPESCVQGGIVDEWADDWGRCANGDSSSQPYMHNPSAGCDELKPGQPIHSKWFGMSERYTFIGRDCVSPRFQNLSYGFRFNLPCTKIGSQTDCDITRNIDSLIDEFGYVVERENQVWTEVSLCTAMGPTALQLILIFAVTVMSLAVSCHWCVRTRAQREDHSALDDPKNTQMENVVVEASAANAFQGTEKRHSKDARWIETPEGTLKLSVPEQLGPGSGGWFEVRLSSFDKKVHFKGKERFSKKQASLHLKAHASAQNRRLGHQLACEIEAVKALNARNRTEDGAADVTDEVVWAKAMRHIHGRALEGYMCWLETQYLDSKDEKPWLEAILGNGDEREAWMLYVETLLLRLIESLAEQALHAPEFISAVFHNIRFRKMDKVIALPANPVFQIRYDLLHHPLEDMCRNPDPFRGGINLDDVNDKGVHGKEMFGETGSEDNFNFNKTYRESWSVLAIIDIISNFMPVILVKFWIFCVAFYVYLGEDRTNGTFFAPKNFRSQWVQIAVGFDAFLGANLESTILLHGMWQGRLYWTDVGYWIMKRFLSLLVTVCGIAIFMSNADFEEEHPNLFPFFGYVVARLLIFKLFTRTRRFPVCKGRPTRSDTGSNFDPEAETSRFGCVSFFSWSSLYVKFIWATMLGLCFIFEVYFVAPLAAGFKWGEFCQDSCRLHWNPHVLHITDFVPGSDCFACTGALVMIWVLVGMTAFFDIYYMFYVGTSIFGYVMGEARGLRHVLSTTQRVLTLDIEYGVPKVVIAERATEVNITDGEAMRRVFGASWRILWSRMIEALYEECLIKEADVKKMVAAARTVRWTERLKKCSPPVLDSTDKFAALRFVVTKTRNGKVRHETGDPEREFAQGRGRCISKFFVKTRTSAGGEEGKVHEFPITEPSTLEVHVKGSVQEKLVQALQVDDEQNLVLQRDFSELALTHGSVLISGGDVRGEDGIDLQQSLSDVCKGTNTITLNFRKATVRFGEIVICFSDIGIDECDVKSVSFSTASKLDDPSLDPIDWRVEALSLGAVKGRKRQQLESDTEIWKTGTLLLKQSFEPPTEREKSLKMDNTFFPQPSKCVLPGEEFSELRFKMLSTRGGLGLDRGKGRCISKFIVVTSPDQAVHEFVVDDFATVEVTVENSQKAELRSALTSMEIVSNQKVPKKTRLVSNSSAPLLQSAPEEAEGPTIGSKFLSPVDSLGLERGWTVISGCDFVADNSTDLERALRAFLEGSSSGTLLVKKTSPKFAELEFKFSDIGLPPQCVTAVTFAVQTQDDLSLDPVSWVVEGLPPGVPQKGDRYRDYGKQLVVQHFDPPLERGYNLAEKNIFFSVEGWRRRNEDGDPGTNLDMYPYDAAVKRNLGFFMASLRGLMCDGEDQEIKPRHDTLMDCAIGRIPCLTQCIPAFNETVIITSGVLKASDGVNTNLGFIISQFPDEWLLFAAKHKLGTHEIYIAFVSGDLEKWVKSAQASKNHARVYELENLIMEVRMWASMRSQTVSRTVVGALRYHQVLAALPSIQDAEVPSEALEKCVELVLAHQTFGSTKSSIQADSDIRYLLRRYEGMPFFIVFDYDRKVARPQVKKAIENFLDNNYRFPGGVEFASVVCKCLPSDQLDNWPADVEPVEIVEVLPRYFPLLVGQPGFMTQGKAGNQLGALRFAKGHYMMMMDCNMGAFLGEACKVPFVLRKFQPPKSDRRQVKSRIIGFREVIFTADHGNVGNICASAEWAFGTICQRFLSGLGHRMHYGHPDFFDALWATNRGSLSKASTVINVSEDIFAGFNVKVRGETSDHIDYLAWEKGRESSFNSASLFFTKISKGNVGVARSRDLKLICDSLNVVDNFSFFFASVGFYLNNVLIDFSLAVYVSVFVMLTLASKNLNDLGKLESALAAEWVASLGITAMIPRFMELVLEVGPLEGIMTFIPGIPSCMAMFTLINKSISSGVVDAMWTGEASYIATGRPNANTHYNWRECYAVFVKTHFYPALQIFAAIIVYHLLSYGANQAALPMMVVIATCAMWIISPIIFCPQPTLQSLAKDLDEFWQFCIATPARSVRNRPNFWKTKTEDSLRTNFSDPQATLYEFWLLHRLQHKRQGVSQRVLALLGKIVTLMLLLMMPYNSMLDHNWTFLLLFLMHTLLMGLWRLLNRPVILTLTSMLMWFVLPILLLPEIPKVNLLFIFGVLLQTMRICESIILLGAWVFLNPNIKYTEMKGETFTELVEKKKAAKAVLDYDIVVEYLFVNFMHHQIHLYGAVVILALQLVTQTVMVLLDRVGGFHSWFLLNERLRSSELFGRRRGYEPSINDAERNGPTPRKTNLSGVNA